MKIHFVSLYVELNNNEDDCKFCCCDNAATHVMKKELKSAYGQASVLKWCIWWAVASAGYYQITNYVQALWEEISETGTKYNAAVDVIHRLLGKLFTSELTQ